MIVWRARLVWPSNQNNLPIYRFGFLLDPAYVVYAARLLLFTCNAPHRICLCMHACSFYQQSSGKHLSWSFLSGQTCWVTFNTRRLTWGYYCIPAVSRSGTQPDNTLLRGQIPGWLQGIEERHPRKRTAMISFAATQICSTKFHWKPTT